MPCTRTNAGTAWRGQIAAAPSRCRRWRNGLCRISDRYRLARCLARPTIRALPRLRLLLRAEIYACCSPWAGVLTVSYTHLRAHETRHDLVCRLLLEKKKN